jgi:hypothetical protein
MTRFRDLPGGIDRGSYLWPMISVIHPEHGAYDMDVHCLRDPDTNDRVLVAYSGRTKPNSVERKARIDRLAKVARGLGDVIEPITEDDVTGDIAIRLAAELHTNPVTDLILMPLGQPDVTVVAPGQDTPAASRSSVSDVVSSIIFPAYRKDRPEDPWLCTLCSGCGRLDRKEPGAAEPEPEHCGCVPTNPQTAVIGLMIADTDQVRARLTECGIAGDVIERVVETMFGGE